jgi:hypothetical protein
VPGTWTPLTSRTIVILESFCEASYRSSASVRARRTRLSSKGFFSWCIETKFRQSQGLSCTVILLPIAWTS